MLKFVNKIICMAVSLGLGITLYTLPSHTLANSGEIGALHAIADETERLRMARQLHQQPHIDIPRLAANVQLDGRLDEPVWQQAYQLKVPWQFNPVANVPAAEETLVYLFEDGETLFVAFDARSTDPGLIRAYLHRRDQFYNDDYVGFAVDTAGDGNRAFQFFANPLGVQGDATINASNGEDFSYDAIFDTAGAVHEHGYVVEFAVPFSQLRFPRKRGLQYWRFAFFRTHWADRRYQTISFPVDLNEQCFVCNYEPAQGMSDLQPGRQLQLVPSFTARHGRSGLANAVEDSAADTEVGIEDMRWGITPDLSLNATFNPDFSQIEADIAQSAVNTAFVLFFPERRPFFLEGRDLFNTQINLVNTRNIADPDWGLKLSGKVGNNVYGLMSVRDEVTNFLLGGFESSTTTQLEQTNQSTVMRYRRDFQNASNLGVLATHRTGSGYNNTVIAADGTYRLGNQHTFEGQYARSRSELPQSLIDNHGQQQSSDDHAYRLQYRYRDDDWFVNLDHRQIGADFAADLGFINSRDLDRTNGSVGWRRQGQSGATVHHVNAGINFGDSTRATNGNLLWRGWGAFTNVGLPGDTWLSASFFTQQRRFQDTPFDLTNFNMSVSTRPRQGLSYRLNIQLGDQIDVANVQAADEFWMQHNLEYNLNQHWLLRLRHTYQELTVSGGRLFETHLTDMRLSYQFNLQSTLLLTLINRNTKRFRAQYIEPPTNRSEGLDAQLRYSYQINPRSVAYLGYASSSFGDDEVAGLEQDTDSIFLKLTYAWDW